jgi:hypothetical protein
MRVSAIHDRVTCLESPSPRAGRRKPEGDRASAKSSASKWFWYGAESRRIAAATIPSRTRTYARLAEVRRASTLVAAAALGGAHLNFP